MNPLGASPLSTADPSASVGDVRASIYSVLAPLLLPDVPIYIDSVDQGVPLPAVLYRFENVQDRYAMGSRHEAPQKVYSSGFLVVHALANEKGRAVDLSTSIQSTLSGLTGRVGTVEIGSSLKLVDKTDAEMKDPVTEKSIFETRLTFKFGWCE